MPKFPFTNYHELNLDWILKKVNALFDASEENARTIRTYDSRLTSAEQTATSAATAATSAQQLADAAAATADNALSVAGTADQKADSALTAATDASSAVSGALTAAQEAQQTAGAAVATANDAAATASSLESLANTANQNATAAVETAGTANQNATAAQTAANTADQKAVAAQQTANSAQSAAATNAGNITTLQTNVTDLNRQISDSKSIIDNGIRSIYPTMLFPAVAMSRGTLDTATFIDGHGFGTVIAGRNIVISGNENLVPNSDSTSSMPDDYFSVFLQEGTYIMHVLCGYAEYSTGSIVSSFFYAEKTERIPRNITFANRELKAGSELTATFQVATGWYMLRLYFPVTTPINIKYWLTKAETSVTAMLLENM